MSENQITPEGSTGTPSLSTSDNVRLDDLLTTREVSELTGLGVTSLDQYRQRWKRGKRLGPAFIKVGWNVFYTRQAVEEWIAARDRAGGEG